MCPSESNLVLDVLVQYLVDCVPDCGFCWIVIGLVWELVVECCDMVRL